MVLMDEHTAPPGASLQGLDKAIIEGFIRINKIQEKIIYLYCLSVDAKTILPFHGIAGITLSSEIIFNLWSIVLS